MYIWGEQDTSFNQCFYLGFTFSYKELQQASVQDKEVKKSAILIKICVSSPFWNHMIAVDCYNATLYNVTIGKLCRYCYQLTIMLIQPHILTDNSNNWWRVIYRFIVSEHHPHFICWRICRWLHQVNIMFFILKPMGHRYCCSIRS